MMRPNVWKAIGGGAVGTLAMTVMMYSVAPMMLGRPMDVAAMLGSLLGGSWAMGMLMHVLNGAVIFPLIYAYLLYQRLSGEAWVRGTVWGLVLWFVSQALAHRARDLWNPPGRHRRRGHACFHGFPCPGGPLSYGCHRTDEAKT